MGKRRGYSILDGGHDYGVESFDGEHIQAIRFMKRHDLEDPGKYPGNTNSYPGTTLQVVLRILIDRVEYLQDQKPCVENKLIRLCLMLAIWLLEFRAANRHGKWYLHGLRYASYMPICTKCGHTICDHK